MKAFTLVETLVVIAVLVIVGGAITSMWLGYDNFFTLEGATIDVAGSASRVATATESSVMQADAIVASHSFSGTTLTTGTNTLVLELPSVDSSGNVISGSHDYIAIYASSTNAYEMTDAASGSTRTSGTIDLSDALQSLTFSFSASPASSATSTTIDVRTSTSLLHGSASDHLSETLYLRNI